MATANSGSVGRGKLNEDKMHRFNDVLGKEYDTPESINLPVWFSNGTMMIRRDALDADNPEHEYNYCKRVLNVRPENYGIMHPYAREFGDKSREELIDEIIQLRKECISMQMYG